MYPKLKKPRVGKQGVVSSIELAYLLLFTALAIILHIFQFPFPLATFLAYDLSGIPIAMLTLINVRLGVSSLPIFWLGLVYLTRDPTRVVGPSMKVVAEAFTAIPLAVAFKRFSKTHSFAESSIMAFIVALISRVGVMLLLNYIVAPYWLVWAGWMKTFEAAHDFTVRYLPYNALFNATVVCYVAPATLEAWKIIRHFITSSK
jgi:riboflavin transporter FmnP